MAGPDDRDRQIEVIQENFHPEPGDNDLVDVEGGNELSPPARETLAQYVNNLTTDPQEGNKYPVSSRVQTTRLNDDDGVPVALDTTRGGAERIHAAQQVADDGRVRNDSYRETLSQYSNSGIIDDEVPLSSVVVKGQSKLQAGPNVGVVGPRDGNDLLIGIDGQTNKNGALGITTDEPTNPALRRTSRILQQNRWNPSGQTQSQQRNRVASIQRKFGEYDPDSPDVEWGQLRRIGKSLSLRQTGEGIARKFGSDPEDGGVQASTILPGIAQLAAVKISTSDLDASEVFREVFGEDMFGRLESDSSQDVGDKYLETFGVMNNSMEHFDSLAPLGMIALSTALVLATQLVVAGLSELFGAVTPDKTYETRDRIGRPLLGKYKREVASERGVGIGAVLGNFVGNNVLGLVQVDTPFDTAVQTGVSAFFGSRTGLGNQLLGSVPVVGELTDSGDTARRIRETPGYYAVFTRNIARSSAIVIAEVKNMSFSNPIKSVQNVMGIIDLIKRSKLISMMNFFAVLGDRVRKLARDAEVDVDTITTGKFQGRDASGIDRLPNSTLSHIQKSRRKFSTKLAWRDAATNTLMVLPVGAAAAIATLGGAPESMKMLKNEDGSDVFVGTQGRLSDADAQLVEAKLEAEYMPFYFRDMRTNEVISFHAFVSDLGESFSPAYQTEDSYGRVDSVMIYQKTERKIDVSFYVVALDEEDMDFMWAKINKLVTLVYPQWSEGLRVSDGEGNKFIQPFSQVIKGSPMIRMRLGDLWKTNYSRFNLGRIFGLGTEGFKLSDGSAAVEGMDVALREVSRLADRLAEKRFEPGDILKARYRQNSDATSVGIDSVYAFENQTAAAGLGVSLGAEKDSLRGFGFGREVAVKVKSVDDIGSGNSLIIFEVTDELANVDTAYEASVISTLKADGLDNSFFCGPDDLIPHEEFLAQKRAEILGTDETSEPTSIGDFFDPKKNIVMRTFEQNAGQGLAGFITNMSFDWNTQVTWETAKWGTRAPKNCKVTISFAPIHDIPPGIDASGFNRAPLYNVGSVVRGYTGHSSYASTEGEKYFNASRKLPATDRKKEG